LKKQIIVLIVTFIFVGCNYQFRDIPRDEANTGVARTDSDKPVNDGGNKTEEKAPPKPEVPEGGEFLITEVGKMINHTCNNSTLELDKDTTSNTVNVRGICRKIIVDGVSNNVFAEEVGEIVVRGISNKVIYKKGIGGGKPKISVTGTSTSAKQAEPKAEPEDEERKPK
jgi:hypothetical protein